MSRMGLMSSVVLMIMAAPALRAEPAPAPRLGMPAELESAFNAQIASELAGAQSYLQLSADFAGKSLDGFASWFTVQYYEELNHARMLMDFVKRKNGHVALTPVALETVRSSTALEAISGGLALEEAQTARIHALDRLARDLDAPDAGAFLQFFLSEQVQEEDMFKSVQDRLALVETSADGLLLIDHDLGERSLPDIFLPSGS